MSVRHELVQGAIYAMAGGSANHNRIAGKLYARLLAAPDQSCRPFISDMKLSLNAGSVF